MPETESKDLRHFAARLGMPLEDRQVDRLLRYRDLVLAGTKRMNLTGARSKDGILRTLILDSLCLAHTLPTDLVQSHDLLVVDVGSGAGVPGIPLAILFPDWRLVLVESVQKKARFIEETARALSLDSVMVVAERAETLGRVIDRRDRADVCLARAVAGLPTLLEYCAPLTKTGGWLIFPKSGPVESEIRSAETAAEQLRCELSFIKPVEGSLGLGQGKFTVAYRKTGVTPERFPRRTGLARSSPI
jgi:16S rRNA (guanine527-N7)-methyltransferase